jgi:peroxiredoxin
MTTVVSTMLPLGTTAPDFRLPDTTQDGKAISLKHAAAGTKGLLVIFLANHCPYVQHIINELTAVIKAYQPQGLTAVAISSSDVSDYPNDSPASMARLAGELEWTFPYLYDETQETAKAYHAACTPDIYLFDADLRLIYRGQFDDSRPGNSTPVTGRDLRRAIEAVLKGNAVPQEQTPSIGCNIKWKPGNEPDYFNIRQYRPSGA